MMLIIKEKTTNISEEFVTVNVVKIIEFPF